MSGQKNTKLKLLYLKEIFEQYTDEDNVLNSGDIAALLEEYGISCERKSIYKDIDVLIEYGMDIVKTTNPKKGFFLASRNFELAEIRLINDALQAANFITKKKTAKLIEKTDMLVSKNQAAQLKKQVFINNRNKCDNEEIFYNIDTLDKAIKLGKKVKLRYIKRKLDDKFTAVSEQKEFVISPYALIWSNDRYYLAANKEKYDNVMNMRLDRMKKVEILDEPARHFSQVSEYKNTFDSADYAAKTSNMFSGKAMGTELKCKTEILEEMLDRFGAKVSVRRGEEGWFYIHEDLYINDGLASWIMQFGDKIEVIYPSELRALVKNKASDILSMYSAK